MTSFREIFLLSLAVFTVSEAIKIPRPSTVISNGGAILNELSPFAKPSTDDFSNLIVFINPKSGGNKGGELLKSFQKALSAEQVFDLTQGGPKKGLELYKNVPNLRILACGGDGTVGWVLSVLDQMNFETQPSIAILPLGTGNDLARSFGWGGGYNGEFVSTILKGITESFPATLDRWNLNVSPNPDKMDQELEGENKLPLSVMNNYFSFGLDAQIALDFHTTREKYPKLFQSQVGNKIFYGRFGGLDMLEAKWRNLHEMVTVECDGVDITEKLKKHHVSAVVFLNIPMYGGGTRPWSASDDDQSTSDGIFEVVGLGTLQLPGLQMGKQGTPLAQCKTARIVTFKSIPMQVDGEANMMKPSIIELSLLNKASMLAKEKKTLFQKLNPLERLTAH